MSEWQQQAFYDEITNETEKLALLKSSYNVELDQRSRRKKIKEKNPHSRDDEAEELARRERIDFLEEVEREAQEKNSLLQCIINEAEDSGYPLPPSLIRLLNSNNGK